MGNLWEEFFFSRKYSRRPHRDTQKFILIQINNGDHEWCRMTNAFILCDLLWKVKKKIMQRTAKLALTKTEGFLQGCITVWKFLIKHYCLPGFKISPWMPHILPPRNSHVFWITWYILASKRPYWESHRWNLKKRDILVMNLCYLYNEKTNQPI